jgi:ribosomal protein S24E
MKSFLNNENINLDNNRISIFDNQQSYGQNRSNLWAAIDDEKGLLIIHPDMLISPTKIVEAMG